MYFSGVDSTAITIDVPSTRRIIINSGLYDRVRNNEEENARIFLDTRLLKPTSKGLMPKSKASMD